MPFSPPVLDDRNFDDLVEELVARIPAHTPEWTNPRLGDPGRTLIDLFAWLTDTLLYRANLIPERQRLVFLRLLGIQMRPALAALGLITVTCDVKDKTDAVTIRPLAGLARPVPFETRSELTLLPVTGEAYYKRRLTTDEEAQFAGVLPGLQQIYRISTQATPYVATPVFVGGAPEPNGFDLVGQYRRRFALGSAAYHKGRSRTGPSWTRCGRPWAPASSCSASASHPPSPCRG